MNKNLFIQILLSIPTAGAVLSILWFGSIEPTLAKEFVTKAEGDKLEAKIELSTRDSREGDIRIEKKLDDMNLKIERIYEILIKF